MDLDMHPLGDRVIVQRDEHEKKTASGIVIPDNAAEKPDQGTVVAVGPGKRNENGSVVPLEVKVGDTVIFGKYSGTQIKRKDKEFSVMREEDILAIVKKCS